MGRFGAASEERGRGTGERQVGEPVSDTSGAPDEKTFEQLLEELEAMTRRMAAGDIGIEAAATLYERAGELHAQATERLARVQERIARLAADEGDGS
jgi:exodeoxyribonuclease VII small subunit